METFEHTFPLPETEVHKLEELTNQLPSRSRNYVQENALMLVAISSLAGCLIGLFWPRKSRP